MKKTKKNIGKITVALLLILSTMSFATVIEADEYEPQDTITVGLIPSHTSVETGDTFNITVYMNPDGDFFDSFIMYNLTYDYVAARIVNSTAITDVDSIWNSAWLTGTTNNEDGYFTDLQGMSTNPAEGYDYNITGFVVDFLAVGAGVVHINISSFEAKKGLVFLTPTTYNTTVTVYPKQPATLSASTFNYTAINLTFSPGAGGTYTTLCGKAGSYPTNPQDSVLYNNTGTTFDHEGLDNSTLYYYRAWTWNETTKIHSTYYLQDSTRTDGPTNFTFTGITPADTARTANCTYSIPVNLTVRNSAGHTFNYVLTATNGQSASGSGRTANTSIGRTLTGLSHNTTYWWNVTVTDGVDDTAYSNQSFTTGWGGGATPTISTPAPVTATTAVPVTLSELSVLVTDTDGDPLNTTFYWANNTIIGYDDHTESGQRASVTPGITLLPDTTYSWYARATDGCLTRTSSTYTFTTATAIASITKEWGVMAANNTIKCYINVTNTGQMNLTNVFIEDTWSANLAYISATPAPDGITENEWTIPYLNTTGFPDDTFEIVLYLEPTGPVANGATFTNSVTATANSTIRTATATPLTMSFESIKYSTPTILEWNSTYANWTINVTNTGDFYLDWVQITETFKQHSSRCNRNNIQYNNHKPK